MKETRFYMQNPSIWPQPSLREQIEALESVSKETAYMKDNFLHINVVIDPKNVIKYSIKYTLIHRTNPKTAEIQWLLIAHHNASKRPELSEIVVTSKITEFRGVILGCYTYWTNNIEDYDLLKSLVKDYREIKDKIKNLIGKNPH